LFSGIVNLMAAKRTDHRPEFLKNVVQAPFRTSEQAAFELLSAISRFFPDRINQLRDLGRRLHAEVDDEADADDPANADALNRFVRGVREWTTANNIASPTVDDAAEKWATGGIPDGGLYLVDDFDENLNLIKRAPSLQAYPFNETRDEFLEKAGKYYDEIVQLCVQKGSKLGPVKRDVEHFRYLAAHLVGGYTWAEIAHGDTPLDLSRATQQAVAEGARETAALLGIVLTTKRGARKGARRHPRPLRR
jgi:hypothetical protein